MAQLTHQQVAKLIDHAVLKPQVTRDELKKEIETCIKYHTASVCVRSCDVAFAHELLKDTDVLTCTVIGFPSGMQSTEAKVAETLQAIRDGAEEVDMVLKIGLLVGGQYDEVKDDIQRVCNAAHDKGAKLKVIFECCYLNSEQIAKACEICNEVGVDFIKTSTGFGTGGAKPEDVALMRKLALPSIGVKASGGIHNLDELMTFVDLGATRIGASATEKLVNEAIERGL